jgi:nitrous oxide reductase accessory protein NosL
MKRSATIASLTITLLTLSACDDQAADAPPALRPGEDVCAQCNMIISDVRWATATIVEGPRGPEARLFDDFNCQVNYEVEHDGLGIEARWSHDHATSQWLPTHQATFLVSPALRTPMGSGAAAFASTDAASAAASETPGDVVDFKTTWQRLGHTGALCHHDHAQEGGRQ